MQQCSQDLSNLCRLYNLNSNFQIFKMSENLSVECLLPYNELVLLNHLGLRSVNSNSEEVSTFLYP